MIIMGKQDFFLTGEPAQYLVVSTKGDTAAARPFPCHVAARGYAKEQSTHGYRCVIYVPIAEYENE